MSNINQQKLINNNKMRERYISVGGGPFERIYTKLWGGKCVFTKIKVTWPIAILLLLAFFGFID